MPKRLYRVRGDLFWVNYAAIVRREADAFEQARKRFLEASRNKDEDNIFPLRDATLESGCVAIVFAALTLEAMIYDFGAIYLSDEYVREHLDRLDPVSKWIVFPRLVFGIEFPKNHHSFELLQGTFRIRNELVHKKSVGLQKDGEKYMWEKSQKRTDAFYEDLPTQVAKARRAIDEVPEKLYEITKEDVLILHFPKERQREMRAKTNSSSRLGKQVP